MFSKEKKERIIFLLIIFIILYFSLIYRLYNIQVIQTNKFKEIAQQEHLTSFSIEGERGNIYDRNYKKLAVNINVQSLFAIPPKVKNPQETAQKISSILNLKTKDVLDKLNQKKSFVWIKRKLKETEVAEIKKLNLEGLNFLDESKRYYPKNYLASNLMGFVGIDNQGREGLESFFDKELKGLPGLVILERDAIGGKVPLSIKEPTAHKDGHSIVLTIDEVIQYIAERELDKAYVKHNAKGATIIVMNPYTGAILALANRPTFDLNEHGQVSKDKIRDRALCDLFEPGSVFKIITASAALEEKKVTESDKFFCENGLYKVGSHILHDHDPLGWLTFRQVIEQSSNIGTVKAAQILGADTLYKYIKLFGFGTKTGIELPGEISGIIREPKKWSKISIAAVPIGQEVAVTAIQIVRGMAVIANGGQLVRPYVIKEIRDSSGEIIKEFKPAPTTTAISPNTALRLRAILSGVVEEGTGRMAKIEGISAAGKTGTAQKLEPNGTYSHSKFVGSFVGFAPADVPMVAIAVIIDEPHPNYYGGVVAAPVFKNVASDVIRYLRANQVQMSAPLRDEDKKTN
ncbi:MAG: penicillin-binding transpeptidase domain-containing protein [Candidatus Omnitrophota bacterium]